jgi:hypothetical protein
LKIGLNDASYDTIPPIYQTPRKNISHIDINVNNLLKIYSVPIFLT